MKLWLDDVREPPDESWAWAKTFSECRAALLREDVTELSLDHDLGFAERSSVRGADEETNEFGEMTGYHILEFLEYRITEGGRTSDGRYFIPSIIHIHTMNAGARPRMEAALKRIREISEEGCRTRIGLKELKGS